MKQEMADIKIKIDNNNIFSICFIILYFLRFFEYFAKNTNIKIFNREIGFAATQDFDVTIALKNIYILYLVFLPIISIIVIFLVNFISNMGLKKIGTKYQEILSWGNKLSVFFLITILGEIIQKFNTSQKYASICDIIIIILMFIFLYPFLRKEEKIEINDLNWILVIGLNVALFFSFFVKTYIGAVCVSFCILIYILNKNDNDKQLKNAYSILALFMSFSAFSLEFVVILNQKNIIIKKPIILLLVLFLLICVVCGIIFKLQRRIKNEDILLEVGLLLGALCYAGLPLVQQVVSTDLYEQANIGIPFQQLVDFHKIPFVETVSAHLTSDWISSCIYYLFNRNVIESLFSPYMPFIHIAWILILYFVLRKFMNSTVAVLFCLLFPLNSLSSIWGTLSIISILALYLVIKRDSWRNQFIFWIILLVSLLYKPDVGLAMGLGVILSYIVVNLVKRQHIKWVQFFVSGTIVGGIAVLFYSLVCIKKGINVLNRIKEFLEILGGSNEIWSNGPVMISGNLQSFIIYFVIPVMVIVLLVYYIFLIKKGKTDNEYLDAVILVFGISYFINLQRLIVRHNIAEGGYSINLTFTAGMFVALICYACTKKHRNIVFVCSMMFFCVLLSVNKISVLSRVVYDKGISSYNYSLGAMAVQRIEDGNVLKLYELDEKVNRVQIDAGMRGLYEDVVTEINNLLLPNETFFDFSNQTLIYALAKRELPVYVAQSPGLLVGEHSQKCFVEELEKYNCPIAISATNEQLSCGISIDGVQNAYRQYIVSEYLVNNYTPIESVGGYVIWVKNDRADIVQKIIGKYDKISWSDSVCAYHDCKITVNDDGITLKATGNDPFITDVSVPNNYNGRFTLSIPYTSDIIGQVQLFYTNDLNIGYSETKSIIKDIQLSGVLTFELNSEDVKYIRIDIPQGSEVRLSTAFSSGDGLSLTGYDFGEYESLHVYNLGAIPYLWGTADKKEAYTSAEIQNCENFEGRYVFDYDALSECKSLYLKVVLECPGNATGNISIGVYKENKYNESIRINFNSYKGEQTYLIRISADSNWRKGDINSVYVDQNLGEVKSISFIQGD